MNTSSLHKKLKNFSLEDAIKIEESDRQFVALKNLSEKISDKWIYLWLIVANSVICYQLSWKWEDYWEEFSDYFWKIFLNKENFLDELKKFLKQCKNNKRFIDTKISRLEKIFLFFEDFFWKEKFFYQNMEILRAEIAKNMRQKKDAKTIVFAVKMFWYWARNIFDFEKYPEEIEIPIDSRLEKLFEKFWEWEKNSKIFYKKLSEKLKIPELHLDAILWVNYEELMR